MGHQSILALLGVISLLLTTLGQSQVPFQTLDFNESFYWEELPWTINGQPVDRLERPFRFDSPVLAPNGKITFASGHKIFQVSREGALTELTSSSAPPFYEDGPLADARFRNITALTYRPDGALLIGDSGNRRIRILDTDNTVSTYAGNGIPGNSLFGSTLGNATFDQIIDLEARTNDDILLINSHFPSNVFPTWIRRLTASSSEVFAGSDNLGLSDGPRLNGATFNDLQDIIHDSSTGATYFLDQGTTRVLTTNEQISRIAGSSMFGGFQDPLFGQELFDRSIGAIPFTPSGQERGLVMTQQGPSGAGGIVRFYGQPGITGARTLGGSTTEDANTPSRGGSGRAAYFHFVSKPVVFEDGTILVATNEPASERTKLFIGRSLAIRQPPLLSTAPSSATVGETITINSNISSGETIVYSARETQASISGNQITLLEGGTIQVQAIVPGNETFSEKSVLHTIEVEKLTQTISSFSFPDVRFEPNLDIIPPTITSDAGNPVFFTYRGPLSTRTGHLSVPASALGVGEITVTAFSQETPTHKRADSPSVTFNLLRGLPQIETETSLTTTFPNGIPLRGTSQSNAVVDFSIVSGPGEIRGSRGSRSLKVDAAGTIVVRAFVPGTSWFEPEEKVVMVTVTKGQRTISLAPTQPPFLFGAGPQSPVFSSNLVSSANLTVLSGPATAEGTSFTPTGVGPVTLRAFFPETDGYLESPVIDFEVQISKGEQILSFSNNPGPHAPSATIALQAESSSGLSPNFRIISGPGELVGSQLRATAEGAVTVEASQGGDANWNPASTISRVFEFARLPQIIQVTGNAVENIMRTPFVPEATASSNLPVSIEVISGPAEAVPGGVRILNEGTVILRFSQSGSSDYLPAEPLSVSFIFEKLSQVITFPAPSNISLADLPFTLEASSDRDLPITYTIVSGPGEINGAEYRSDAGGLVTLRASQDGDEVFNPATPISRQFFVQIPQTLMVTLPDSVVERRPPFAPDAVSSSGLAVGFAVIRGPAVIANGKIETTGLGVVELEFTQEGTNEFAPAVPIRRSFEVRVNAFSPERISVSPENFFDNLPPNGTIGKIEVFDQDEGDFHTLSLVSGPGDNDNSRLQIVNGELQIRNRFSAALQSSVKARIRATDTAGQSIEQEIVLRLLPANPNAAFRFRTAFTAEPSYVNTIFQLVDAQTGKGLNYPTSFFDSRSEEFRPELFQVLEAATSTGNPVPISESYFEVAKLGQAPFTVRTVLLLDTSGSISDIELESIKEAACAVVEAQFPEQEIAIYSFTSEVTRIADFTAFSEANQEALMAAIATIGADRRSSTNLYGAAEEMLLLEEWTESFSREGIETGFLVVLTDGEDSSGVIDLADFTAVRDQEQKQVFTVGLGDNISVAALTAMQNRGYIPAQQASQLPQLFQDIQQDILNLASSYYWYNYASPKAPPRMPGTQRKLVLRLQGNQNTRPDSELVTTFLSDDFRTLESQLVINRRIDRPEGLTETVILPREGGVFRLSALTILPRNEISQYEWSVSSPSLLRTSFLGRLNETMVLETQGRDGTVEITVQDVENGFSKSVSIVVGSGIGLPEQSIQFLPLRDRFGTEPPFTLEATSTSLLPVSYEILSGPAQLTGTTLSLDGIPGRVIVRALQVGNESFASADPVIRQFEVFEDIIEPFATEQGLIGQDRFGWASPFGDGVTNFEKFAYNLPLTSPASRVLDLEGISGLPRFDMEEQGASLTFVRRRDGLVRYQPQESTSLNETDFVSFDVSQTVTIINDTWERVSLSLPFNQAPKKFWRVKLLPNSN